MVWPLVGGLAIFAVWAAIVAVGVHDHVFWRDEVRALTLALKAPTIFVVPAAVHGEGHPALWYVLLRGADDLLGGNIALPVVSVICAAIGVSLFLWKAPFPLWWKPLFVFCGLPLFEYSVMARNYGLAMPLMFAIAIAMSTAWRGRYWALAILLFLLSQTNIQAALTTPFFALVLVAGWRGATRKERAAIAVVVAVAAIGVCAALATVYPPRNDLVASVMAGHASPLKALIRAVVEPGQQYPTLIEPHLDRLMNHRLGAAIAGLAITVLLYGACLALLPDAVLFFSAVASLWITAAFASLIYAMSYRHAGIWLIFLLSLYWIRFRRGVVPPFDPRGRGWLAWTQAASLGLLTLLMAINVATGVSKIWFYHRHVASDSRALGAMITADPLLRRAILLPEYEEIGEALPYYVGNDMYLAREHKFGRATTWTRTATADLSLGRLLSIAQDLRRQTGRPVLILLAEPLTPAGGTSKVSFAWRFSATPAEVRAFEAATTKLPLERKGVDENFDVYKLQ